MSAVDDFLAGELFAVVGASADRSKFGNRVLRHYLAHGRRAIPVHPSAESIEGQRAYPDLQSLPEAVHGVSIITPPPVTERVVAEALALSMTRIWMQPGAENAAAIEACRAAGVEPIFGGPCVLVELRG